MFSLILPSILSLNVSTYLYLTIYIYKCIYILCVYVLFILSNCYSWVQLVNCTSAVDIKILYINIIFDDKVYYVSMSSIIKNVQVRTMLLSMFSYSDCYGDIT